MRKYIVNGKIKRPLLKYIRKNKILPTQFFNLASVFVAESFFSGAHYLGVPAHAAANEGRFQEAQFKVG